MNKRVLFVLAGVVLFGVGLYFQAKDASDAQSQATAITAADVAGSNTDLAMATLRSYVAAHMGTTTTVHLTGSYNRAAQAATASSQSLATYQSQNEAVYHAAQAACMSKANSIVQADCNAAYLQSHLSGAPAPSVLPQPKLAAYDTTFTAPVWTTDTAGVLMIAGALCLIVGLILPAKKDR